MKIIFAGTPQFAVPALEKLNQSDHEVLLVISQPDRPSGRGRRVSPTAVKKSGLQLGLGLFQPDNINSNESLEKISSLNPDVMVVAAFGQILKKRLLEIPRYGCINIHTSLLPLLRGAAPIQRAIMEGHSVTGVTTIQMSRKMDEGDILLTTPLPIETDMTAGELHDTLAEKGADLIMETIEGIEKGSVTPRPQNHDDATYAPKIETAERLIDWTKDAIEIDRKIRGLSPSPGAFTFFRGKRILILRSSTGEAASPDTEPGRLIARSSGDFEVQTGNGTVSLRVVCPEGRREMAVGVWAAGARIKGADCFNSG